MKKFLIPIVAAAVLVFGASAVLISSTLAQNTACGVDNCMEQGGNRWSVGGTLDILSTGAFDIAGTTVTASAAELNQAADNSANAEVVIATNVITAAESGATFFLNATTEFVSTLPAAALGLRYKFIVTAAPASASYTIVTTASANTMTVVLDALGTTDAGDIATARDVITFVDAQSVAGDWVECISDGTNWFCSGTAAVAAGITTGQT